MFAKYKIRGEKRLYQYLDKFLLAFRYDQKFLRKCRQYKKIDTRANPAIAQDYCFINNNHKSCMDTFYRKAILRPEVGKSFRVLKGTNYNFMCFHESTHDEETFLTCNWYDQDLPKLLKKLGLRYKITPIHTRGCGSNRIPLTHCRAYELIDGMSEFRKRPLISFMGGTELKTDCVSLAQLETAARKFGLPADQLKLVNDWIIAGAQRHPGCYNNLTGKLFLSNKSLSTLAHEGLHHMVNWGLIRPAEYQALVDAGAELISRDPARRQALNKTDPAGKPLYPRGTIRDEECAAVFIEDYYARDKPARQALLNHKMTRVEKFIRYVRTVVTSVKGFLGSRPARAESFLRRVENGLMTSRRARSRNYQTPDLVRPSNQQFGLAI